jgi:hypothetical protein
MAMGYIMTTLIIIAMIIEFAPSVNRHRRKVMNRVVSSRCYPRKIFFTALLRLS